MIKCILSYSVFWLSTKHSFAVAIYFIISCQSRSLLLRVR